MYKSVEKVADTCLLNVLSHESVLKNCVRDRLTMAPPLHCGGVCGRAVNTSNSRSGGPGFKLYPSRCFLRQGTFLHFVSLDSGL